jgi:hypothetical protein
MSYEVDGPTNAGFYRLQYTDLTAPNLEAADFDGDGLSNLAEITQRPRPTAATRNQSLQSNSALPVQNGTRKISSKSTRAIPSEFIQTNPLKTDTDGDGLTDKWEEDHQLDPTDDGSYNPNNGPNGDPDQDDLDNRSEIQNNTNPFRSDTDYDYLPDGWEIQYGLIAAYSIQIDDTWVYGYDGVNGSYGDPDADGIQNQYEYVLGFDPQSANTHGIPDATRDRDGDGLPDFWEAQTGAFQWSYQNQRYEFQRRLDWERDDANEDLDSDELTNLAEYQKGTHLANWDTDGDLLPDGWEIQNGLNPLSNSGNDGMNGDPDQDGLVNIDERIYGSSPTLADTDGDGVGDVHEITQGSDPADGSDGGQPPPPEDIAFVKLTVGDPSGSESERYNMIVKGVEGDTRTITHQAKEFGVVSTKSYKLRKGAKYEIEIVHTGTKPDFLEQHGFSNYDWIADIQPDGLGVALEPAVLVKKDPHTIFTEVIDWPNDTFQIKGKKAELFVMKFETITIAAIPYDAKRKKLGVAEGVEIYVTPLGAGNVTWTMADQEDSALDTAKNYEPEFTAASLECNPKVKADFGNGIYHIINFQVVEPTGESAEKEKDLSLSDLSSLSDTGITAQQQGVGMLLRITLLPDDVSFQNLEIKELSGPASNENGYFEKYKGGVRYHTAEDWLPVEPGNQYGDTAAFFTWPKIMVERNLQWIPGSYEWDIPLRWRAPNKTERTLPNRLQKHEITANNGSSTVTKLLRSASRTPTP